VGLREARLRRRLTQDQLADLCGIKQPAIATLERLRDPNPKWSTVAALATVLNISPWKLFGRPRIRTRRDPSRRATAA
jgi:transcriptional regulator with XRE-family HTH domain